MLTGRKLLLADDSLTIQKVVSLTFNDEAMQVVTVGSGAEAVEKLNKSLPDIILADVHMPEPNGYQLCERIKRDERTRHIPVVLLVGSFEPFNEAEARRVGADDVLTKPFQSIRDLMNKVGGLLGGSGQPEESADRDLHSDEEADRTTAPSAFAMNPRAAQTASAPDADLHTTADAFADYDMDDATIQTTPVNDFDARKTATSSAYSEIKVEEQFSDRGETEEAFTLDVDAEPLTEFAASAQPPAAHTPPQAYTAAAAAAGATDSSSSSSSSPAVVAVTPQSAFARHMANAAEADDALLELGDAAPSEDSDTVSGGDDDDFILDMGDAVLFDAPAASPPLTPQHDAENDPLFAADETPHVMGTLDEAEDSLGMSSSHTDNETAPALFVQAGSESAVTSSPEAGAASWELSMPDAESAPAELENEAAELESASGSETASISDSAPALERVTDDESAAAVAVAAETVEPESVSLPAAVETSFAHEEGQASSSEEDQVSSASMSSAMSPEMIDEIVRRVVAHMSPQVIREVAWEVVPDLAERLIKQRLEEESSRPQ